MVEQVLDCAMTHRSESGNTGCEGNGTGHGQTYSQYLQKISSEAQKTEQQLGRLRTTRECYLKQQHILSRTYRRDQV